MMGVAHRVCISAMEDKVWRDMVTPRGLDELPEEVRDAVRALAADNTSLRADGDRLREELERQAAEIERLRNKKAQACTCATGPAVWCTACLRAEAASQEQRNRGLMQQAVDALDREHGWLTQAIALHLAVDRMRDELTKGVTP